MSKTPKLDALIEDAGHAGGCLMRKIPQSMQCECGLLAAKAELKRLLEMLEILRIPHDSHACERPDGTCWTCARLLEFDAAAQDYGPDEDGK